MQHGERERELMIEVAHFRREVEMAMQALATALRERDAEKAARVRAVEGEKAWCAAAQTRERDLAAANARADAVERTATARFQESQYLQAKVAETESALAAARRECDVLRATIQQAAALNPLSKTLHDALAAGTCSVCGGPIFHREGTPGEYDHDCRKALAAPAAGEDHK